MIFRHLSISQLQENKGYSNAGIKDFWFSTVIWVVHSRLSICPLFCVSSLGSSETALAKSFAIIILTIRTQCSSHLISKSLPSNFIPFQVAMGDNLSNHQLGHTSSWVSHLLGQRSYCRLHSLGSRSWNWVRSATCLLESETCEEKEEVVGLGKGSIGRQGKLRSEVCINSIQDSSLSPSRWKGSNAIGQAQSGWLMFLQSLILHQGLRIGLCCWLLGHSAVAVAKSVMER